MKTSIDHEQENADPDLYNPTKKKVGFSDQKSESVADDIAQQFDDYYSKKLKGRTNTIDVENIETLDSNQSFKKSNKSKSVRPRKYSQE
jgi:hypothetical protein